jgi:hypothetical protein
VTDWFCYLGNHNLFLPLINDNTLSAFTCCQLQIEENQQFKLPLIKRMPLEGMEHIKLFDLAEFLSRGIFLQYVVVLHVHASVL